MNPADLSARMEIALVARAKGGPTADPPVGQRAKPRASMLAYGCARKIGYWLTGAPETPMDAVSASAMQQGSDLEAGVLEDFCAAMGMPGADIHIFGMVKGDHQVRINAEWFTGSADLVVTLVNGERWIVDSKTANTDSFDIKKREGMSPEHRTQLSLYAHGLDADRIVVVLRNTDPRGKRGKPPQSVYHVQIADPDKGAVEAAKVIAHAAMEAKASGTVDRLPRAFEQTAWQCRWCSFNAHCWSKP